jgi:hypothetical protein
MIDIWHKDFIGVYKNAYSKEFCNNIINIFNQNPQHQHNRQILEETTPKIYKNDVALQNEAIPLEIHNEFITKFFDKFYTYYTSEYPELKYFSFHSINHFKVQRTLPTEGYHVWHSETGDMSVANRILAWTLYLNDVEEGGETEFLYQSLRIPPKTGTLCIFPAYFTHLHRGNPPLSGVKYIATGWVEFINQNNNE